MGERKWAHYLRHIRAGLAGQPTPVLRLAQPLYRAQLMGEHAAVWELAQQFLDLVDAEVLAEPPAGSFLPACPTCGQRRDRCLCHPVKQVAWQARLLN